MIRRIALALSLVAVASLSAQTQTMKQLARGTEYAAASMMPQATAHRGTRAPHRRNAFDAIVAGQAVLGVVQPNLNGVVQRRPPAHLRRQAEEGALAQCEGPRRNSPPSSVRGQPGRQDPGR